MDMVNEMYVPLWERSLLTVEEAASYFGIGRDKIKEISNDDRCSFVLWVGTKRMIKRKKFEEYLEEMYLQCRHSSTGLYQADAEYCTTLGSRY